ncbi:YlmH family RNA-binding protein [Selenomonas massiliensis]|uniref:YlmH family RNA-binding protein n=1 Tax=Selenomonas massiliensis TaxID=2058293 RepID=UPI000D101AB7|nr:YlmH/Sll1252 family protein [Selenomonas massiliensis]
MAEQQRERILRFYRGSEGEETAMRLLDLAEAVMKTARFRISPFLDPYGQEIAETICANCDGIQLDFDGGYVGAERQRAMLRHRDFAGTPDGFSIACVEAAWNGQFARLTHRDVLGAVMGLGIERELIGDILPAADTAKIICDAKIADFIVNNLTMIGAVGVKTVRGDVADIAPREERTKEIRATVASLRLDSIVAAGFGISRSRAADDIAADKVKLNWQSAASASKTIKEGDVLSMRGRGRVEVTEVRGQTKKGRTVVVLNRFF